MTALDNRRRKARALAAALHRRGLTVEDVLRLPYAWPKEGPRKGPTVTGFARQAFEDAGADEQPPSGPGSQTWSLTLALLAWMAAHPDHERTPAVDLLDDRPTWIPDSPVMLRVDGRPWRCPCGANVFRRDGEVYTCNACGEAYTSAPEEEPCPSSDARNAATTSTTTTSGDAAPTHATSATGGRPSAPAAGTDFPREDGASCHGCGVFHRRYGPLGGGALCPSCRALVLVAS